MAGTDDSALLFSNLHLCLPVGDDDDKVSFCNRLPFSVGSLTATAEWGDIAAGCRKGEGSGGSHGTDKAGDMLSTSLLYDLADSFLSAALVGILFDDESR